MTLPLYDQLYACARDIARRMVIFAFLGLLAAVVLLLVAFVAFKAGQVMPAVLMTLIALVTGASSYFLRRAADRYDDADQYKSVIAIAEGVAYETAYWRTTAICALIGAAAIAIPIVAERIANGFGSGAPARTVQDMSIIAAALDQYAVEHHGYPNAKDIDALAPMLRPYLQKEMPRVDGWRRPLIYEPRCGANHCTNYRLVSLGANGAYDVDVAALIQPAYKCDDCPVPARDLEIVHSGGHFVLLPR